MTQSKFKILIYAIGSLGDSLISVAGIKAARNYFGEECAYTLLSFKNSNLSFAFDHSFLKKLGLVNDVIYYDKNIQSSLLKKCLFGMELSKQKFDVVIYLAPSEREGFRILRDKCFFYLCGIKKKIGFHAYSKRALYPRDLQGLPQRTMGEAEAHRLRLKKDGVTTSFSIEDLLGLRKEVDHCVSSESIVAWMDAQKKSTQQTNFIALCPGTKDESKKWAMKKFIKLGKKIKELPELEVMIIGSQSERKQAQELIDAWGGGVNACGQFDILGTAKLLTFCASYIGLDSGVTHLAAAMSVPSICISSDRDFPGRWDIHSHAPSVTLRKTVSCGGCRLRACNQKEHYCMDGVHVEDVFQEFKKIMKY